jgi:hypothetical protein
MARTVVATILLAGIALFAQTAPDGGAQRPLALEDVELLLKMKAPAGHVQKMVEKRGVDFAVNPRIATRLKAEGADPALIGLLALNLRASALPGEPPAEYTREPDRKGVAAVLPATPGPAERGSCQIDLSVAETVEITLQGRLVLYDVIAGARPSGWKVVCTGPLPAEDRAIHVQKIRGRGQVLVMQRPSPQNGFLARVRIEDPAPGDEPFQLQIDWTSR